MSTVAGHAQIGMANIKERRLSLPVPCHPGDHVGDYVPFYFGPRSIMLFVIHCANHPGLTYRGGQDPIVHLEADLHAALAWSRSVGRRWAFSLSNAGANYAEFRCDEAQLDEINWSAVAAVDFRDQTIKESKQSEFLMHGKFPWHLVSRIGVRTRPTAVRALAALDDTGHRPAVVVQRDWYY
jgi:hypothetical protein